MTIIHHHDHLSEPSYFKDIREDGFHIYNLDNAEMPNYYPDELPDFPGVALKELKEDDIITVWVYFGIGSGDDMRVDGGYLDLRIEFVDVEKVLAAVITELPDEFALSKGESIEVFPEEILYKNQIQ